MGRRCDERDERRSSGLNLTFGLERERERKKDYIQREIFHAQRLPPFLFEFFNGYLTKFVLNVFFNGLRYLYETILKLPERDYFISIKRKLSSSKMQRCEYKGERKRSKLYGKNFPRLYSAKDNKNYNFQDVAKDSKSYFQM